MKRRLQRPVKGQALIRDRRGAAERSGAGGKVAELWAMGHGTYGTSVENMDDG